MNQAAIVHFSTLSFRQPIARNSIYFRLMTSDNDIQTCILFYRKRTEAACDTLQCYLSVDYHDGIVAQWTCTVPFEEEAHYIKYYFLLIDANEKHYYFCEHGFSKEPPLNGHFELLQANETDVLCVPQWAKGITYYQIFAERFARDPLVNPDAVYASWNEEPTRTNFLGGNLNGITTKLPYLESLGISCIYITPIFKGDFNHKYATTDYFEIDPCLGTTADLITFVQKAHQLGIRILLDGVFNHVGIHFAPFEDVVKNGEESSFANWFYIKKFPVNIDELHYECVGDYPYMPRLRTTSPGVRSYILKVMLHWIDVANIDGWRLDVADEIDASTLRYLRQEFKLHSPNALLLGETWGDASRMIGQGDQLDCAMNYLFRDAMIDYFAKSSINEKTLDQRLQHMLMKYPEPVNQCMYNCISSHDTARFLTEADGELWRIQLAIAFQCLFIGSPAFYYGDEIGMMGDNDPGCRAGMRWDQQNIQLLEWTKQWCCLRKQNDVLRYGKYQLLTYSCEKHLFAFKRFNQNQSILAFFNTGYNPISIDKDLTEQGDGFILLPHSVEIIKITHKEETKPCEP